MSDDGCSCERCQAACRHKPGWFMPGEAEKAAALVGLPLKEFFEQHLGVDWLDDPPEAKYLLSPATKSMDPGGMFPANPRGTCVFYIDGRCSIYAARPYECRDYVHSQSRDEALATHRRVAEAWKDHQDQLRDLLDDEPCAEEWSHADVGGW